MNKKVPFIVSLTLMLASLTSCQSGEVRATKIEFTSPFSIIEEGESVDLGITFMGLLKK